MPDSKQVPHVAPRPFSEDLCALLDETADGKLPLATALRRMRKHFRWSLTEAEFAAYAAAVGFIVRGGAVTVEVPKPDRRRGPGTLSIQVGGRRRHA